MALCRSGLAAGISGTELTCSGATSAGASAGCKRRARHPGMRPGVRMSLIVTQSAAAVAIYRRGRAGWRLLVWLSSGQSAYLVT